LRLPRRRTHENNAVSASAKWPSSVKNRQKGVDTSLSRGAIRESDKKKLTIEASGVELGYLGQVRLSAMIRGAPFCVGIWDARRQLVYANDAWHRLVGSREGNSMGTSGLSIPEHEQTLLRDLALPTAIEFGLWKGETCAWNGGGTRLAWRVFPVRRENGELLGVGAIASDIHERRLAAELRRESECRLHEFAQHSPSMLWIIDVVARRIDYLSPIFECMWGVAPNAMIADFGRWTKTIHPEDRAQALSALSRAQQGETTTQEYRVMRPDGSMRWIRNTHFPLPDRAGLVQRVAGVAQDITRQASDYVYIVAANPASHEEVMRMLRNSGRHVKVFTTPGELIRLAPVLKDGCVILDLGGLPFESVSIAKDLKMRGFELPVVVVDKANGDVASAVLAMKMGAFDFLEISEDPDKVLKAVTSALTSVQRSSSDECTAQRARAMIAAMPSRELDVLKGLLAGGTNKTIARKLGISPRTVEIHRARVMERLGARTLPEAILWATAAGLTREPAST
jgi:PAS domain S-box-containing protein